MIGIGTKIAYLLLLVLAMQSWLVYVAAVPMSVNRFVATGLRAMIGMLVLDAEQGGRRRLVVERVLLRSSFVGRAFSLIALIESISAILATTVFNGLYPQTLKFYDGTMFVATAIAITIPLVILA